MSVPTVQPDAPVATYTSDFDRAPTTTTPSRDWSPALRVGFRFFFTYVVLYTFPGPLGSIPGLGWLANMMAALMHALVPSFGRYVLRMTTPISLAPSGSGDKLFDWVQVALMFAISLIVSIVWTLRDRRRTAYPRLFAAFHIYVRFTLAAILLGYGLDKVFPNQFEAMNPVRLTQYFGEAAPGGFAWFFLGFSIPYVIFAGAGETISALLLYFRRTTTLGAIVGGAVLTNVFAINMAYDIPVKLYSFHLLLLCVFLVACDAERMLNVFIRNRAAAPLSPVSLFTTPRSRRIATIVGTLLAVWTIGSGAQSEYSVMRRFGRLAPRGPLWGIYEIQQVEKNGVVQPQLLSDRTLWRRVSVSRNFGTVRFATDSLARYGLRVDSVKHTVRFTMGRDTTKAMTFAYAFPDTARFELRGVVAGDSVTMRFARRSEQSYLLVNRGFHWVNEAPLFR